jgi:triosephosphate isomerase
VGSVLLCAHSEQRLAQRGKAELIGVVMHRGFQSSLQPIFF